MKMQVHNTAKRSGSLIFSIALVAVTNVRNYWLPRKAFSAFYACILLASAVQAAEFIPLGDLEGGGFGSSASDVSADGSVVVGWARSSTSNEVYRWTAESGMVVLNGAPGGWWGEPMEVYVSADGSTVVGSGRYEEFGNFETFRWTSDQGTIGLGSIHDTIISSFAHGVSADGNVVVGQSIAPGASEGQGVNHTEAYRWTSTGGMVGLGDLPDHRLWSSAYGVSADGSVVVGSGNMGSDNGQAFRWTEAGGMVGLGDLPGGEFGSGASGVSADGSVVVGASESDLGVEAFRWTEAGGMVGLGDLPGGEFSSKASGASADGNVIVGNSQSDSGDEFFVWTQASGMQRLQDILVSDGSIGLSGWSRLHAGAISDNGQWVVGEGTNPSGINEAFLAQLPDSVTPGFKINAGLNDAWYDPVTDGQGFFITVFPDLGVVSLAWFTYDTELPPIDATANLGDAGHRWLTAVGPFADKQAVMNIEFTSGGIFDTPGVIQRTDPPGTDGTLILTFDDCNSGTIEYDIPSIDRQGTVPIQRVADDNVVLCQVLGE